MPDIRQDSPQRPSAAQKFIAWLVAAAKLTWRGLRRLGIALLVFGRALYDPEFALGFNRRFQAGRDLGPDRSPDRGPAEAAPKVPAAAPATPAELPRATLAPAALAKAPPDSALLLLGLFQKEARLVDFLQQDVGEFSDQQVGAAARVVHAGLRHVLDDCVTIAPVRGEPEGGRITLPAGFDQSAVRITGQLIGEPPFKGTLVHAGWKAQDLRLPMVQSGRDLSILAPAEVEL